MASLYELNKQLSELLALDELDEQTLADTWEALALERSESWSRYKTRYGR